MLKTIERAISTMAGKEAIAKTQTTEERRRSLRTQLVVRLVIAFSFWSSDSMRDVVKNLIDGYCLTIKIQRII